MNRPFFLAIGVGVAAFISYKYISLFLAIPLVIFAALFAWVARLGAPSSFPIKDDFKIVQNANSYQKGANVRNVVVTGGCGFLGRRVVEFFVDPSIVPHKEGFKLEDVKYNIFVLDAVAPREPNNATYIVGDLRNKKMTEWFFTDVLQKLVTEGKLDNARVHSIVHIASIIPGVGLPDSFLESVNVGATEILIESAKTYKVERFVYTSSSTALLSPHSMKDENLSESLPFPPDHLDTYTSTKRRAEKIVLGANGVNGLHTAVIRPGGIYGRYDNILAEKALKGLDRFHIGDGQALIDFVHVDSVASCHFLAEQKLSAGQAACGQVYNACNGQPTKYADFMGGKPDPERKDGMSAWGTVVAKPIPIPMVKLMALLNESWAWLTGRSLLGPSLSLMAITFTQRTYYFDISKARRDLGYEPIFGGDALKTVRWMAREFASENSKDGDKKSA